MTQMVDVCKITHEDPSICSQTVPSPFPQHIVRLTSEIVQINQWFKT